MFSWSKIKISLDKFCKVLITFSIINPKVSTKLFSLIFVHEGCPYTETIAEDRILKFKVNKLKNLGTFQITSVLAVP